MALADGKTLGLALSGGGFRATLFGLGSLWRLNDAGLLGRLDRVTSVSGGAILAGVLASAWRRLNFDAGRADNFQAVIAGPLQQFCAETADIEAGLLGWITPFRSAADYLRRHYKNELFGDLRLHDLPQRSLNATPLFVFYATNLQTGRSLRFRQDFVADYWLGVNERLDCSLATAVTASSAFPPIFSPVRIECDATDWRDADWDGEPAQLERLRSELLLADGGIYDNMGLESLNEDIRLISDAGAPFGVDESPRGDYFSQLGRVRDILIDQTRALRKRNVVQDFEDQRLRGAYWGIGTRMATYPLGTPLARDSAATDALAQVSTRLAKLDEALQGRLINWGYALADAGLRSRAALNVPAVAGLPLPQFPLD